MYTLSCYQLTPQAPCFVLVTCSDITVLIYPPLSCIILPCYLHVQDGLTPVLRAAYEGHTPVIDLLVKSYQCSLTEVDMVSALDVLQCSHELLCVCVW